MTRTPSIRPAVAADIVGLVQTFRTATKAMLTAGIGQWHYDYPTIHHVEKDISQGSMFVYEEEGAYASISFEATDHVKYPEIQWRGLGEKACYIHRLVVHPWLQGRGLAYDLCRHVEEVSLAKGILYIRLDSYQHNAAANALYLKLGFSRRTEIFYFHNNVVPFYLYEKWLG